MHEYLVERLRDLGQVQADALRVKKQPGIVWMALARSVKRRLWLGGAVSTSRDMALLQRLLARVRRCALRRPLLVCTDGLSASIRVIRETLRASVSTRKRGRPRLRPWRNILIAQVVKHYERATCRARLTPLAHRGRALARHTLTLYEGMFLLGTVHNFCTPHTSLHHAQKTTPAMAAGIMDHCWTMQKLLSFHVPLSRWAPPKRRGRPSRARLAQKSFACFRRFRASRSRPHLPLGTRMKPSVSPLIPS